MFVHLNHYAFGLMYAPRRSTASVCGYILEGKGASNTLLEPTDVTTDGVSKSPILRKASPAFTYLVARSIALCFPERLWYLALLRITRIMAFIIRRLITLTSYRSDLRRGMIDGWLMNAWLQHFPGFDRAFPVPISTNGAEDVLEARTNPTGLVYCCVHVPLANFVLSALVEMNCPPTAVVSDVFLLKNGMYPVWGSNERLPGLVTDRDVLLKARTILRHGGSVAAMIDSTLGEPLNRNIFRLIRSLGARVIFAIPELQANGEVLVAFYSPPDPFCTTDETIVSNIDFIQAVIDRVIFSSSSGEKVTPPQRTISPRPS